MIVSAILYTNKKLLLPPFVISRAITNVESDSVTATFAIYRIQETASDARQANCGV
jgi:hypothetical protein